MTRTISIIETGGTPIWALLFEQFAMPTICVLAAGAVMLWALKTR